MRNFFKLGSPAMEFMTQLTSMMVLSVLWILCCIPIITAVPATAALYYVSLKMVRKEACHVCKTFLHGFLGNLKQGIVLNILFIICTALLIGNWLLFSGGDSTLSQTASVILLLLSISFLSTALYTFPLQAQFRNTIPGTLKNAFILSGQRLTNTVIVLFLHLFPVLFALLFSDAFLRTIPAWVLLAPAGISYLCAIRFAKIFDGYMPLPSD